MKVAACNMKSLFNRAKAFNDDSEETWLEVTHEAKLNLRLEKEFYTSKDKVQGLVRLQLQRFLNF